MPSKLPPARYLMYDSGILLILLVVWSSSMRQGSSRGSGVCLSNNCLRIPPGVFDYSSAVSLLYAISSLFFTENLGFLSKSASMSCLLPNCLNPSGASSSNSWAVMPIFSGFRAGATLGVAFSSWILSYSMLRSYFLMTCGSI